jgi:nucleobase:cation symporter-1, NCS1 family
MTTASSGDRAGQVEVRGIDHIPDHERHGTPRALFGVWAGATLAPLYFILGGLLMTFGFNLWQAFLALVLGYAFWVVIGAVAIAGPRAGTPTITISRAQYGLRGNIVSASFAWFNLVAFVALNFTIGLFALEGLAGEIGWTVGDGGRAVLLAAIIALTFVVAYFGHATLLRFQAIAAVALAVGAAFVFLFIVGDVNWSYAAESPLTGWAGFAVWLLGLNVIMSGALSWCSMPADYSRYLPAGTPAGGIALWTALGGALPSLALGSIGILAGTVVDMSDPATALEPIVPGWFYPVFLLLLFLGSTTNNTVTVYSSSLSLQAMGIDVRRTLGVVANVMIGTGMAVYAVFVSDFLTTLATFLAVMLCWYGPFAAIFLVDLYLRRRYDGVELHRPHGRYWYDAGIHRPGLIALAGGITAALMFANTEYVQGPLSAALNDTDLSGIVGILVGGGLYWLLAGPGLRREARPAVEAPAVPVPAGAEPAVPVAAPVEGALR